MNHKLFFKAQCSAFLATIADFTTSAVTAYMGIYYLWATLLGSLTGGCVNFAINFHFVFHPTQRRVWMSILMYLLTWIGSIVWNTGGTFIFTKLFVNEQRFMVAKVVAAILVAFFWNYPMQRYIVFNHQNSIK